MDRKAQARFIEYILTIFFGVVVLISISILIYSFYMNALKNEIRESLRQITLQTSDGLIRIYGISKTSEAEPENYTSILLSEKYLNLPDSVSKRNYEVLLVSANPIWSKIDSITVDGQNITFIEENSGAKIIAQTTQDPIVIVEHYVPNIDISVQGKSENGRKSNLIYYRYNIDGEMYDTVILGEDGILMSISKIS